MTSTRSCLLLFLGCLALGLLALTRMDLSQVARARRSRAARQPTPRTSFNTSLPSTMRDFTIRRLGPGSYDVLIGFNDASSAPTVADGRCMIWIFTVRSEWIDSLQQFSTRPTVELVARANKEFRQQDFTELSLGLPQAPYSAVVVRIFEFGVPYPPPPGARGRAEVQCYGQGWGINRSVVTDFDL